MNALWIGPIAVAGLLSPLPLILAADWIRARTCEHRATTVNMAGTCVCLHCRKVLP